MLTLLVVTHSSKKAAHRCGGGKMCEEIFAGERNFAQLLSEGDPGWKRVNS